MSASLQRRHALRIIHYNDVYNINVGHIEPVGGAARFITAVQTAINSSPVETLVLFSGDAFSPAPLTPFTEGAEIPPVLNATHVEVACIGNHELDRGLNVMKQRISETNFPWLLSNVDDTRTERSLGDLPRTHVLERGGLKLGLLGLAGLDWLATISIVPSHALRSTDFVTTADIMVTEDKALRECDAIIALTHMRQPDDLRLAQNAKGIDVVLGGHDHIIWKRFVNGRWVVKSGSDFKTFSTLDVFEEERDGKKKVVFNEPKFHYITSKIEPDPYFDSFVKKHLSVLGEDYFKKLAICTTELDGRFVSVRTRETGLGNLVCDALTAHTGAPIGLINSGSFRSDSVEPPGPVTRQTIDTILPFQDEIVSVKYTGSELLYALENSVSQYPLLDGRFLQMSGIRLEFDPSLPANARIIPGSVTVRTNHAAKTWEPLNENGVYIVATKTYVFAGKDGFRRGDEANILSRWPVSLPTIFFDFLKKLAAAGDVLDARDINGDGTPDMQLDKDGIPVLEPLVDGRSQCLQESEELTKYYKAPAYGPH